MLCYLYQRRVSQSGEDDSTPWSDPASFDWMLSYFWSRWEAKEQPGKMTLDQNPLGIETVYNQCTIIFWVQGCGQMCHLLFFATGFYLRLPPSTYRTVKNFFYHWRQSNYILNRIITLLSISWGTDLRSLWFLLTVSAWIPGMHWLHRRIVTHVTEVFILIAIKAWISNYIHITQWYAITHPCLIANVKLGHGWIHYTKHKTISVINCPCHSSTYVVLVKDLMLVKSSILFSQNSITFTH